MILTIYKRLLSFKLIQNQPMTPPPKEVIKEAIMSKIIFINSKLPGGVQVV
jgi:hypothetical protein